MTRIAAIQELIRDGRRNRSTTASAKRAVKACRVLELSETEIREMMAWLDYCDQETGLPYSKNIERVWP